MAAKTLGQSLSLINEILPNKVNSTTIITLINNEQRKAWHHMTSTSMDESYTIANQELYSLPTGCEFERIVEGGVLVGNSTNGSTDQSFTAYKYAGKDNAADSYVYYEGLNDTFGILPIPTVSNIPIHIRFQPRPTLFASTDTSVQYTLNEDFIEVIELKVMSKICKIGNNPDVEMANNYEMDAQELEKLMKVRMARDKCKSRRNSVSYKEGWRY